MKAANPLFPILIREAKGAEAKLTARYGARTNEALCPFSAACGLHLCAVDLNLVECELSSRLHVPLLSLFC